MYAIVSDIKRMYHQIFVSPEDGCAFLFVWNTFSIDPIKDYRISVYIFGKIDFI